MDNAEDDHDSPSDEDYDPSATGPPPIVSSSSEAEDEPSPAQASRKKRKAPKPKPNLGPNDGEDLDFENSGDEATIQKGRRRKSKVDEDEGGEGGLVKTRAQRKAEGKTKRPLAETRQANVDVNALWAQMAGPTDDKDAVSSALIEPVAEGDANGSVTNGSANLPVDTKQTSTNDKLVPQVLDDGEPMVTIKRKYDFAGQTMEEERQVLASSAAAKLYQAELQKKSEASTSGTAAPNRPKKRKLGFGLGDLTAPPSSLPPPKKLNTIEKSKLDWAAHVDKEGIAEELDEHSRAKDAYLGRMDFLDRMTNRRVDDSNKPG